MSQEMVSVNYASHEANGFADVVQVPAGTTVRGLFESRFPGKSSGDYKISVNGNPTAGHYPLRNDDSVLVTPTKVQGA